MNLSDNKLQTILGIAATIALFTVDALIPNSGLILVIIIAVLAIVSIIRGPQLPLSLRVVATSLVMYFGFLACLGGRTMEPRFTAYTFQMALVSFVIIAGLPVLALLRIWSGRMRAVVVASIFPISLAIACAVATYEEHQFIQTHKNGIGPTARWTVSHHWLAYDAEKQKLYGSD